ncbi:MAG: type 4a pilus biogenesis protein PilO [Chloroflexi bacterium]|nr:type 4a pilus biogenesis protein PilO [Chloroflexota bacterium]
MRFGFREYLLLLLILSLPVTSYLLVFQPQNREIAKTKAENASKQAELSQLREQAGRTEDLIAQNEKIKQDIAAIEARLPTNKEIDAIVRQVSDLAIDAGLAAPLVSTENPVQAAMYMEQPIDMTINGDFRGFYDFLRHLEQLPRLTRIHQMRIQRSDKVNGHMRADFRLSIYYEQERGG